MTSEPTLSCGDSRTAAAVLCVPRIPPTALTSRVALPAGSGYGRAAAGVRGDHDRRLVPQDRAVAIAGTAPAEPAEPAPDPDMVGDTGIEPVTSAV